MGWECSKLQNSCWLLVQWGRTFRGSQFVKRKVIPAHESGCFHLWAVGIISTFVKHQVMWPNVVEQNHLLSSSKKEKKKVRGRFSRPLPIHLNSPNISDSPPLPVPLTLNSTSLGEQAINAQAFGEHSKTQNVAILHCTVPFCIFLL